MSLCSVCLCVLKLSADILFNGGKSKSNLVIELFDVSQSPECFVSACVYQYKAYTVLFLHHVAMSTRMDRELSSMTDVQDLC